VQLQGEPVFQEELEDLLAVLYGVAREGADEADVKAVGPCDLVALHRLVEVAVTPLEVVEVPRAVDAGAERDAVLGQHLCDLRGHPPEIGLKGEITALAAQRLGEHRQRLPIERRPGEEGFAAVEGDGGGVVPEIPEPFCHFPEGLDAHHRRSFL